MHEGSAVKPVESSDAGGIPKFCKRCHYPLRGLEIVGDCPECGREYDLGNYTTYTYDAFPIPVWRKLLRAQRRLILLALLAGVGHLIMLAAANACSALVLLPVWLTLFCFFVMDSSYRALNLQVGFISMAIGFALGATVIWTMSLIYNFEFGLFLALIGGGFGGLSGIFLVYAEVSNLRNT